MQEHQQPIAALAYQTEQLLENHEEELTPEQVTELQHLSSNLKSNFAKCLKTSVVFISRYQQVFTSVLLRWSRT
jgi:hypothetical protein